MRIEGVIGSWEADPSQIVEKIKSSSGDLEISLASVGGSVIGGIAIANAIRDYSSGKVTVIVDSVSASIASYFMMFADVVKVHDNSTVMIHNASLPAYGDYNELRKRADVSEGLSNIISDAYVRKTGRTKNEIKSLMNEETYFYGEEIVSNGFADEVLSTEGEKDKSTATAMAISLSEACNRAILENEVIDMEAVAKFLPVKEVPKKVEVEDKILDLSAKQKRDRDLYILKTQETR